MGPRTSAPTGAMMWFGRSIPRVPLSPARAGLRSTRGYSRRPLRGQSHHLTTAQELTTEYQAARVHRVALVGGDQWPLTPDTGDKPRRYMWSEIALTAVFTKERLGAEPG